MVPVLEYAFLSHPYSDETFIVTRDGEVRQWMEGVGEEPSGQLRPSDSGVLEHLSRSGVTSSWRWRNGWLPILEIGNDYTLVALPQELLMRQGRKYLAYPPHQVGNCPPPRKITKAYFESVCQAMEHHWTEWLESGRMLAGLPENQDNGWKMSLVHARCAFMGNHPKYGVKKYGQFRADGFPPTILSMCGTLLDYRHTAESRELFRYWLGRFVRADGSIDYYGPSLSEYGMLLELAARLADGRGGRTWLGGVYGKLRDVCHLLYNTMNPWMNPGGSVYKLPRGVPEADRRRDIREYFHNAAWMWRGLVELGQRLDGLCAREELLELEHAAKVLRYRMDVAWMNRKAALGGFPPYSVEQERPIADCGESVDSAYANYRYYPELLSSGALGKRDALDIIAVREKRHGEIKGMTRLHWATMPEETADHWTIASYARGLLQYGERERFQRLLANHFSNYVSPDLYYAYESVTVNGKTRHAYGDWCVPAQLALPQMLAWSQTFQPYDPFWVSP
ncbi:MAG: hypothetical protein IJJ33_20010 [Victivallales bacterium]|nr:hypothetical protein [Victivallales bacterium]